MTTAKVFMNGGSQAVRLPKECRFDTDEVIVNRIGRVVLLVPSDDPWASFEMGMSMFTDDCFADGRPQETGTVRETL